MAGRREVLPFSVFEEGAPSCDLAGVIAHVSQKDGVGESRSFEVRNRVRLQGCRQSLGEYDRRGLALLSTF